MMWKHLDVFQLFENVSIKLISRFLTQIIRRRIINRNQRHRVPYLPQLKQIESEIVSVFIEKHLAYSF